MPETDSSQRIKRGVQSAGMQFRAAGASAAHIVSDAACATGDVVHAAGDVVYAARDIVAVGEGVACAREDVREDVACAEGDIVHAAKDAAHAAGDAGRIGKSAVRIERDLLPLEKDVAFDVGVGFNVMNVALFAGVGGLGLAACAAALGTSVLSKTLNDAKPKFLGRFPRLSKAVYSPRTTLFTTGVAMSAVTLAAAASGLWIPAVAGALSALGKFATANSLAQAERDEKEGRAAPKKEKWFSLLFKRPDLYVNASFAATGLMAGGATLFTLPLLALAGAVGLKNSLKNKPEHTGYPLAMVGLAGLFDAAVGLTGGQVLVGAAFAGASALIFKIEHKLTPGGTRQMLRDVKNGCMRALRPGKKSKKKAAAPAVACAPIIEGISPLRAQLNRRFSALFNGSAENNGTKTTAHQVPAAPARSRREKENRPHR